MYFNIHKITLILSDPLANKDIVTVTDKMSHLSDKALSITAKCLFSTDDGIPLSEKKKWELSMKMVLAWKDLANGVEETSKTALAKKLKKAASEVKEFNQEESQKLESLARSLNFRGNFCYYNHSKRFFYICNIMNIV